MPCYTFELTDDEGFETTVTLPGKYEVCPRCKGVGKHDHPAFSNGLTREDFADDPDFAGDYFDGAYDVPCSRCDGNRVVCVPDEDVLSKEQAAQLEEHRENMRIEAEDRAWERRALAMGY